MRPGHGRDFRIDIFRGYGKSRWLLNQIANAFQKSLIFSLINGLSLMLDMPGINQRLQFLTLFKQNGVSWRKFIQ